MELSPYLVELDRWLEIKKWDNNPNKMKEKLNWLIENSEKNSIPIEWKKW